MRTLSKIVLRKIVVGLIASLIISEGMASAEEKSISFGEGLKIIQKHESAVHLLEWSIESRDGKLRDLDKLDTLVLDTEIYCKGKTVFEPQSGRYRFDLERVSRWIDGPRPFSADVQAFSYDLISPRSYHRSTYTTRFPGNEDPPGEGVVGISPNQKLSFMEQWGWNSGIGFFPPFFSNKRLSEYLTERKEKGNLVGIVEREDGSWLITTREDDDLLLRLTYDPTRNGVVNSAVWSYGIPEKRIRLIDVQLQQTETGIWAPKLVRRALLLSNLVYQLAFSNVKVNAIADDHIFTLQFPSDTSVTDYVEQKPHVVGAGPENDRPAAKALMLQEGTHIWLYVVLGMAACAVLLALTFFMMRRGRRIDHVTSILGAFFVTSIALADEKPFASRTHTPSSSVSSMALCGPSKLMASKLERPESHR